MKVSNFDFNLPEELIAKYPVKDRDGSRLLVVPDLIDEKFANLPAFLQKGDVLVLNNTKVIPSRLLGEFNGREYEVTFHKQSNLSSWWGLLKGVKKLSVGDVFDFSKDGEFSATVMDKNSNDGVLFQFNKLGGELILSFEKYGHIPLPPYMKRGDEPMDRIRYQTVYAQVDGSVAAPTAGLHFTDEVFKAIRAKGVKVVYITLHVGAGTFLPVNVDNTDDHKMHSEFGEITKQQAGEINSARENGGRIIAVGSTSLRLMESAVDEFGVVQEFSDWTDIFITPNGYKFKSADYLVTNFHTPKSTLFMLVCAYAGEEEMKKAYAWAIENKYRFYSYGDSSILKCKNHI